MNTTENNNSANALIAEFMDFEWYEINKPYIAVRQPNGGVKHFQTDWNDLMEVVHKITILEEFQEWEFNSLFWEVFCQIDITEIYNQVVLFIEYYNEIGVKN